jgi:cell division protein FtsB
MNDILKNALEELKDKGVNDYAKMGNVEILKLALENTVLAVDNLNERLTKAETEIVSLRFENNLLKNDIEKLKEDK